VLKQPPGDVFQGFALVPTNLKRIPAERMLCVKSIDRIRQIRGVSHFAAVLSRLDDLKDYEESERIAAKVAASMAAVIKKGSPEQYDPPAEDGEQRDLRFRPGMVFDDLRPGEDITMIDSSRPNPNLLAYRQGQMRALACGHRQQLLVDREGLQRHVQRAAAGARRVLCALRNPAGRVHLEHRAPDVPGGRAPGDRGRPGEGAEGSAADERR
jgi:hypothetical protein